MSALGHCHAEQPRPAGDVGSRSGTRTGDLKENIALSVSKYLIHSVFLLFYDWVVI